MSRNLHYMLETNADLEKARVVHNYCHLAKDFTKLLLMHGAKLTDPSFSHRILTATLYIMEGLNLYSFFSYAVDTNKPSCFAAEGAPVCNETMDSLSSLFRYLVVASDISLTNKDWSEFLDAHLFISTYIRVAGHTHEDGRSEKLIRLMLTALSASDVNKLRRALVLKDERNPITNSRYSRQQVDEALKYIGSEDTPNVPESLEHLTVQAIRRALTCRVLLRDESFGIGLPPKLEALVRRK